MNREQALALAKRILERLTIYPEFSEDLEDDPFLLEDIADLLEGK
jgi:hypothetical protein